MRGSHTAAAGAARCGPTAVVLEQVAEGLASALGQLSLQLACAILALGGAHLQFQAALRALHWATAGAGHGTVPSTATGGSRRAGLQAQQGWRTRCDIKE
jgi:hypothetical protein